MIGKISEVWNLIIQSNTFNFIVMVMLLAYIFKKFNLSDILLKMKRNIIQSIDNSVLVKKEGDEALEKAENSLKNLENEIKLSLDNAEKLGNQTAENILKESEIKLKQTEKNTLKIQQADEKNLSSKLVRDAVSNSTDKARKYITDILDAHPELQEKYIYESLDDLDRIDLK